MTTMPMMKKALRTGRREAVSALMIERMDPRRPKMRSTRKHRSSRKTVIGPVVSDDEKSVMRLGKVRGRRVKSQDRRRRLVASKAGTHGPLAGKPAARRAGLAQQQHTAQHTASAWVGT
jgi:hypothetical protein